MNYLGITSLASLIFSKVVVNLVGFDLFDPNRFPQVKRDSNSKRINSFPVFLSPGKRFFPFYSTDFFGSVLSAVCSR